MPIVEVTVGPRVDESAMARLREVLPEAVSLAIENPEEPYDGELKPGDLELAAHIAERRLRPADLLFATRDGTPMSRNTFRTRIWLPAVQASGVDFEVRVHDLRHAHASWLLAGGSDLKAVMDRMGHAQITTTQKYLHPMPDADTKNLTALDRIRNPEQPGGGESSGGEPDAGSDQEPTS